MSRFWNNSVGAQKLGVSIRLAGGARSTRVGAAGFPYGMSSFTLANTSTYGSHDGPESGLSAAVIDPATPAKGLLQFSPPVAMNEYSWPSPIHRNLGQQTDSIYQTR